MTLSQADPINAAVPRPTAAQAGHDLIFVSMEQWDDVWRRNQFVCAAYAARHPGRKILFVAPPLDVTNAARRRQLSSLRISRTWTVGQFPNIVVTQALKLMPNSAPPGRALNQWMMRRHVKRLATRLGIESPVLWLNPHWAGHLAGRMGEQSVIYDVTDDWTALTQSRHAAALVRRQDEQLCRRADAVIVCSQRLLEMKSPAARSVHLIPNGVDADHYRTVLDQTGALPEETKQWRRPILGYTGTIHPDRIDLDLLSAVARQWSGSVVMIGPVHLRTRPALANLILPGPVPYAKLPDYMRAFDVCMVPHRMTPFTESLNPIKLWEYLAAGKPIVSTDVAGFRDYPELVRVVRDAGAFARAAGEALDEPAGIAEARRAEARRHSWESRVDQIEAVIAGCAR